MKSNFGECLLNLIRPMVKKNYQLSLWRDINRHCSSHYWRGTWPGDPVVVLIPWNRWRMKWVTSLVNHKKGGKTVKNGTSIVILELMPLIPSGAEGSNSLILHWLNSDYAKWTHICVFAFCIECWSWKYGKMDWSWIGFRRRVKYFMLHMTWFNV